MKMLPASFFIVCAAAFATPASAASFDCSQAKTPDELAVCGNPALSALDSEMAGLWYAYARVPMLMGASGDRRDDAEAFLATRRACGGSTICLTRAYRARVKVLQGALDAAMAQFSRLQNGN